MDSCGSCGVQIPDGQGVCSMCYGDPGYGTDGLYQHYLDEQAREAAELKQIEDAQWEQIQEEMREQDKRNEGA